LRDEIIFTNLKSNFKIIIQTSKIKYLISNVMRSGIKIEDSRRKCKTIAYECRGWKRQLVKKRLPRRKEERSE